MGYRLRGPLSESDQIRHLVLYHLLNSPHLIGFLLELLGQVNRASV